ncbi:MAG: hypothetical protein KGL35_24750 [Bradyrhizobium sp.]|nr:hypothetical protein [Bradyrhizobium sp.]
MTEKIRVVTVNGWFDMDKPAEFVLPVYVQAIRAAGYILNVTSYVPHEHIVLIMVYDTDKPPTGPQMSGTLQ